MVKQKKPKKEDNVDDTTDKKIHSIPLKSEKEKIKDIIDSIAPDDDKIEGVSLNDIKRKIEEPVRRRYEFGSVHDMAKLMNDLKTENRKLIMEREKLDNIWIKEELKLRTLTNIVQDLGAKIDSTTEKIDNKFITLIDSKDTLRNDFYSSVKNNIVFNNLRKHMTELKEEINIAISEKSVREALKTTSDTLKVMEMLRK